MAAVTSHSAVSVNVSLVEQYHQFCADFLALIKAGKWADADKLISTNKPLYIGLLEQYHPFDAKIETLLQEEENPYEMIVEMAKILQAHDLASDGIRVYQLGGLIALKKSEEAEAYLQKNPVIQDTAKLLLTIYEELENADGPRITLMQQVMGFRPKDETVIDLYAALQIDPSQAEKKV
jgi:hypothetical protein